MGGVSWYLEFVLHNVWTAPNCFKAKTLDILVENIRWYALNLYFCTNLCFFGGGGGNCNFLCEYFPSMEGLSVKKGKYQVWESASALCLICKAIDIICSECRDFFQDQDISLPPQTYLGQKLSWSILCRNTSWCNQCHACHDVWRHLQITISKHVFSS